MKTFFIFLLICAPIFLFGSAVPIIIDISPNPATVGQLVTFTVNHNGLDCFETDDDTDKTLLYPKGKTEGTTADRTSGSTASGYQTLLNTPSIWTYTYTEAGTFTVNFDCADATPPKIKEQESKLESLGKAIHPAASMAIIVNPAPNIPTLSQWGLIVLALCLISLAAVALKTGVKSFS